MFFDRYPPFLAGQSCLARIGIGSPSTGAPSRPVSGVELLASFSFGSGDVRIIRASVVGRFSALAAGIGVSRPFGDEERVSFRDSLRFCASFKRRRYRIASVRLAPFLVCARASCLALRRWSCVLRVRDSAVVSEGVWPWCCSRFAVQRR